VILFSRLPVAELDRLAERFGDPDHRALIFPSSHSYKVELQRPLLPGERLQARPRVPRAVDLMLHRLGYWYLVILTSPRLKRILIVQARLTLGATRLY
jgi:hypothetical protein